MDIYPPAAWERLAAALVRRRGQLGYGYRRRTAFAADSGGLLSVKTLTRLEKAQRGAYPPDTLAAADRMYRWQPGSCELVLAGGEAAPQPGSPGSPQVAGQALADPLSLMRWTAVRARALGYSVDQIADFAIGSGLSRYAAERAADDDGRGRLPDREVISRIAAFLGISAAEVLTSSGLIPPGGPPDLRAVPCAREQNG